MIERFVHGDLIGRKGLAEWFRYRNCRNAVPFLLVELRRHLHRIECEQVPEGSLYLERIAACFSRGDDGRMVPIDPLEPFTRALAEFAGHPFEHPDDWYGGIETWIKENTPEALEVTDHELPPARQIPEGCTDHLIERLSKIDPIDKMGAATLMKERGCKRFVPDLLTEMRDRYGPIECDPPEPQKPCVAGEPCGYVHTHTGPCYKILETGRVLYIDYHGPLFTALSELAVPYFGPDARWYKALDEWISSNLPQVGDE